MATQLTCRKNILAEGISHHQHLRSRQIQSTDTQGEDSWIWLANTHYRRLYDATEITVDARILQHLIDIAIEIGHKNHRITRLLQMLQHLFVFSQELLGLTIDIGSHRCRDFCYLRLTQLEPFSKSLLLQSIVLTGFQQRCTGEERQLEMYLHAEDILEVVLSLHQWMHCQHTLTIHVSIAERRLADGYTRLHLLISIHADTEVLVAFPQHLRPVVAPGIERTAIVENNSLYIQFLIHHFSVSNPYFLS